MKVTVIPERPIKGILPKNKWISDKTELDLNRNEIVRCMKYGSVYYDDMLIFDSDSLNKAEEMESNYKNLENKFKDNNIVADIIDEHKIVNDVKPIEDAKPIINNDLKIDYTLNQIECVKEEQYVRFKLQFNTGVGKIGGNMYGLLNFIGNRPSTVEYKINDNWVKFNNKFKNFSTLEDNDEFEFRFIPKNNSDIRYKAIIKEGNNILVQHEDQIKIAEL